LNGHNTSGSENYLTRKIQRQRSNTQRESQTFPTLLPDNGIKFKIREIIVMNHWREQQLKILLNETDELKKFELASALAKSLDMEYFSYTACLHTKALHPPVETFNNYPKAWNDRYWQCDYAGIDPVSAQCQASALLILWNEDVFRSTPEFREACCCHGLRFGWSQSRHDARKNHSILSVARSHTPVSMEEFHNNAGHTLWMCNLMHELMLAQKLKMNPPAYQLSDREL
jgi:hypothetical protein